MLVGGVTAPGIQGLPIYVDRAVMDADRVVMGGGNRSSKIVLAPAELRKLPGIEVVDGLATPREPADCCGTDAAFSRPAPRWPAAALPA